MGEPRLSVGSGIAVQIYGDHNTVTIQTGGTSLVLDLRHRARRGG